MSDIKTLPILSYGHPTLHKPAEEVEPDMEGLSELIAEMWETMYASNGVGLAAPQVGRPLQLFIMDAGKFDEQYQGIRKVFINPEIIEDGGKVRSIEEGCLSIPHIREEVKRPDKITVGYEDENFEYIEEQYEDVPARIIQHEIDHLEGILFVDRISRLRKRLIQKKLEMIARGQVKVDYQMSFPPGKKKAMSR